MSGSWGAALALKLWPYVQVECILLKGQIALRDKIGQVEWWISVGWIWNEVTKALNMIPTGTQWKWWGGVVQGKSPWSGDPKVGGTASSIKPEWLAWTLVSSEMPLQSPTWTFIAFGCYWRPPCMRKSRAAWNNSTHSLSIAEDLG